MLGVTVHIFKQKSSSGLFEKEDCIGVTNIDVGCMQLNYRWHNKFFSNLSEMINPIKNVDYGAKVFKKTIS